MVGLSLALGVAPSWAQRPPTNDVSDTMANTGGGTSALINIKTGTANTAYGNLALQSNSTGTGNTAMGFDALGSTNGNENTAVGDAELTFNTFVAGIAGHSLIGSQVVVTAAGQLGIVASSARFQRDIQAMGEVSQGLLQLRPVTFRYKQDPQATRQYGLIAEEVAKVYPELVTRGPDGKVASGAVPPAHSDAAQRVATAAGGVPGA
jgi:hypothetical protein